MGSTWYTTREDVRSALDSSTSARDNGQVDRAIAAAGLSIDGLCQRDFAPVYATHRFDWPNAQGAAAWRLWLDRTELISVTSLVSGGTTIGDGDFFLAPDTGPPYRSIEVNLAGPAAFGAGATRQRSIAITGLWGYQNDEAPAGSLAGAINSTTTAVTVTDSAAVGVGQLLRVGTERMTVTGKRLAATGQTLGTALDASKASVLVQVQDGSTFADGEVIALGAERMRIRDVAGDTLTVERQWDGSVLDSHTSSEAIYAYRLLTVVRGAAGTTAATAVDGAPVVKWVPPALVGQLAVAEAINDLLQQQAGYLRMVGSGNSGGVEATLNALVSLREKTLVAHGRQARTRAV